MKKILVLLVSVVVLSSCATHSNFHTFYKNNKQNADFSINTSGFVGNAFIPKEDLGEYKKLLRKVRNYKVMVSDSDKNLATNFDRFIRNSDFSTLVKAKDNGDEVRLYFLKENNFINELIIKVKSDDDVVLVGVKTKITEEEFENIINYSQNQITSN